MWTRQLLKENGQIAFKRNYFICVIVSVITWLLTGAAWNSDGNILNLRLNIDVDLDEVGYYYGQLERFINPYVIGGVLFSSLIMICISLLIGNVIKVGCSRYYLENREHKTDVTKVFHAFRNERYGTTVWIMFLREVYVLGWSLLLLIPGIIKSYSYMLVPFILAENEDLDKDRVFELSRKMMAGHKWEAFVLQISFIGWYILGGISFNLVNIFYTNPYVDATMAEFYSALKAEATQNGIIMPGELPGVSIHVENVAEI